MNEVSYTLSFLAGVLSFLSPCVLPLVPSYLSLITGVSFEELSSSADKGKIQKTALVNSLIFSAGFSFIFISLGASTSIIGQWLFEYQDYLRIGGGILIILFGLFISGFIKMDFLLRERKFHLRGRPAGYAGTFLIGMSFAAGWTPCIGPMLGSILLIASSQGSTIYGLKLLTVYSLGLAVPFVLSAIAFNYFMGYSAFLKRHMRSLMITSGIILIAFGIILITNNLSQITRYLPDIGIKI